MGNSKKITAGILGFGNMGQAIFSILARNRKLIDKNIYLNSYGVEEAEGAVCVDSIEDLLHKCDAVFLCIKPQDFYKLAVDEKIAQKSEAVIISIMAGVTIGNVRRIIPARRIVRTMPNLALQVQESVVGWHAKKNDLSEKELERISEVLDSFGQAIFTEDEDMLNAVTAISGSGPAYVFLFANALMRSAESLGFSKDDARKIVFQTIKGSMLYAQQKNDLSLDELIGRVTSKRGTTEAALNNINADNFYKKWQQATQKAYERAKELSKYDIKQS